MIPSKPLPILIATLGTEPQVVTSTIDLLLEKAVPIQEVLVVHTSSDNPSIRMAVSRCKEALSQSTYPGIQSVRMLPLIDEKGCPLEDIETPQASHSAFVFLYQLIRQLKEEGKIIHFSISGGRKTLALYGSVAAQLLFEDNDHLWYLFSSGDFLTSKRLHPTEKDNVSLVPIPVILWSQVSPVAADLRDIHDPFEAIHQVKELQLIAKRDTARSFIYGSLTSAERRVVEVLVRDGLSDAEIGERLFISPRTVEQHLRSSYTKAAAHWEMVNVNRAQLVSLLQYFFTTKLRENPQDIAIRKT